MLIVHLCNHVFLFVKQVCVCAFVYASLERLKYIISLNCKYLFFNTPFLSMFIYMEICVSCVLDAICSEKDVEK